MMPTCVALHARLRALERATGARLSTGAFGLSVRVFALRRGSMARMEGAVFDVGAPTTCSSINSALPSWGPRCFEPARAVEAHVGERWPPVLDVGPSRPEAGAGS
eukprot:4657137-Pyramimonas_sp.AAC.1